MGVCIDVYLLNRTETRNQLGGFRTDVHVTVQISSHWYNTAGDYINISMLVYNKVNTPMQHAVTLCCLRCPSHLHARKLPLIGYVAATFMRKHTKISVYCL